MRDRLWRRSQREKYIQRWERLFHQLNWLLTDEELQKQVRIRAKTRKPCSCSLCCNKRKLEGKTLQEIKAEAFKAPVLDYDEIPEK